MVVGSGNRTYPALGAVKPHVRQAALEIGNKFDVATIHGIGMRTGASDHPLGLALDFMVGSDKAKGDAIVAHIKQNWKRLGVKYVIWEQKIDEGSGWEPMEDRGSPTANHFDHPHTSFEREPGSGGDYTGDMPNGSYGFVGGGGESTPEIFTQETGVRFLEFIAGIIAIAYVIWRMLNG
jgi:hypothetical protein